MGVPFDSWGEFEAWLGEQAVMPDEPSLKPIESALETLGGPQEEFDVIAVAGTNGKGSTSAYLASILSAHGHRTGLFTSPHLKNIRERFRVDGRAGSTGELFDVASALVESLDDQQLQLSYFEWTVLLAAVFFAKSNVDVAIFEVGLGGRLDATNALPSTMSIITPIGLDHQGVLGVSLEEIAKEKCGIVDGGTPVVVSDQPHETAQQIVDRCVRSKHLYCQGTAFEVAGTSVEFDDRTTVTLPEHLARQPFAIQNAATSLYAGKKFLQGSIDLDHTRRAVERVEWPGRTQNLYLNTGDEPPVQLLLDSAHNLDSMKDFEKAVGDRFFEQVDEVIFGAMSEKTELHGFLKDLVPRRLEIHGATIPSQSRSLSAEQLRGLIPKSRRGLIAPTKHLFGRLLPDTSGEEIDLEFRSGFVPDSERRTIFCVGSVYLAGEVLDGLGVDTEPVY